MFKLDKLKTFEVELKYIKDDNIRQQTISLISELPDYFWEVPASSTGKYHPKYTTGPGGLVNHVKAATRIAKMLLELTMFGSLAQDNDYIISALLLHDGLKSGTVKSNYSVTDHPLLISKFIKDSDVTQEYKEKVCPLVESHMGQWNRDYKTKQEVLPIPKSHAQKFVHICDYLASRKPLIYDFNEI